MYKTEAEKEKYETAKGLDAAKLRAWEKDRSGAFYAIYKSSLIAFFVGMGLMLFGLVFFDVMLNKSLTAVDIGRDDLQMVWSMGLFYGFIVALRELLICHKKEQDYQKFLSSEEKK